METKYNGYKIKYNEDENVFVSVVDGEGTFTSETLSGIKKKLDRVWNKQNKDGETIVEQPKQKGITIMSQYQNRYKIVEAVIGKFGLIQKYRHSPDKELFVWVTKIIPADKHYRQREERERIEADHTWNFKYYYDTPENRKLVEEAYALKKEIYDLEDLNNAKFEKILNKLKSQIIKPKVAREDLPVWDK